MGNGQSNADVPMSDSSSCCATVSTRTASGSSGLTRSRSVKAHADHMAKVQEDVRRIQLGGEPSRYLPRGLDKANHNGIIIPRRPYGADHNNYAPSMEPHQGDVDGPSPQWGWFMRTTPPTPPMFHSRPPPPPSACSYSSSSETSSMSSSSCAGGSDHVVSSTAAPPSTMPTSGISRPPLTITGVQHQQQQSSSHCHSQPNPIFQSMQNKHNKGSPAAAAMGWSGVPL